MVDKISSSDSVKAPPPSLPPSSKAKDYSERPTEIVDELDELRNRGIAKVLNRHFTDTTKKLAKEKAAADAALADLERRRANTSKFVPSKGGDLNPFDSLYVELQQKRSECRRREKETMLLYQRYVHKYSKAAKTKPLSKAMQKEEILPAPSPSSATTVPETPPPSETPTKSSLEPLEEDTATVGNAVNFSKFYNKQLAARDPPSESTPDRQKGNMPELQFLTPQTSGDTNNTSDPPESDQKASTSDPPDEVASAVESKASQSVIATKSLTAISAKSDPPADPPAVKFAQTPANSENEIFETPGKIPASTPSTTKEPVENESTAASESYDRPTKEVMAEIPSATTATDEETYDDRSIISGLTVNSTTTRQVLEEIETEMGDFIKTETEAIKKLLDMQEEDKSVNSSFNASLSSIGGDSVRVALKAEAMALEMQNILDEYRKDDASVTEASTLAGDGTESAKIDATKNYPRKYETDDPSEAWLVHYDESYKREYYHNEKTGESQWDPPSSKGQKSKRSQQISSKDVMPESHGLGKASSKRHSRRDIYRKRLRKRRNRRLAASSLILIALAGTYVHWQANYPEKAYTEAIFEPWNADTMGRASTYVVDQLEYAFTDRRARELAADKDHQKYLAQQRAIEAERKAKEEAEQKAKEAQQKAKEEAAQRAAAERKRQEELAAAEKKAKEEARKRDIELKKKLAQAKLQEEARLREQEEARRLEEERIAAEKLKAKREQEALHRPWGCNLPLAYIVHPRCRKLAKLNPLYDEKAIVSAFME